MKFNVTELRSRIIFHFKHTHQILKFSTKEFHYKLHRGSAKRPKKSRHGSTDEKYQSPECEK